MLIVLGCAVGLFIGAMPGLGSVNGVAILLPITFLVPPTGAIIFLARHLLRRHVRRRHLARSCSAFPARRPRWQRPSTAGRWPLQGKADQALIAAAVGSFVGGTISVVLFTLFAPPLADVALALRAAGGIRADDAGLRHLRRPRRRRHPQDDLLDLSSASCSARSASTSCQRRAAPDLLRHRRLLCTASTSSCWPSASTASARCCGRSRRTKARWRCPPRRSSCRAAS